MYVEGFEAEGLVQNGDSPASDPEDDPFAVGGFAAAGISEVTIS